MRGNYPCACSKGTQIIVELFYKVYAALRLLRHLCAAGRAR